MPAEREKFPAKPPRWKPKLHRTAAGAKPFCPMTSKIMHRSRAGAEAHLRNLARKAGDREEGMAGIYRCPHCRAWHVTTGTGKGGDRR